jgi:catalase-peroxidase
MKMDRPETGSIAQCPVMHSPANSSVQANHHWWPKQLNLKMLHQYSSLTDPMEERLAQTDDGLTGLVAS